MVLRCTTPIPPPARRSAAQLPVPTRSSAYGVSIASFGVAGPGDRRMVPPGPSRPIPRAPGTTSGGGGPAAPMRILDAASRPGFVARAWEA
jgi:hypothetical protein